MKYLNKTFYFINVGKCNLEIIYVILYVRICFILKRIYVFLCVRVHVILYVRIYFILKRLYVRIYVNLKNIYTLFIQNVVNANNYNNICLSFYVSQSEYMSIITVTHRC